MASIRKWATARAAAAQLQLSKAGKQLSKAGELVKNFVDEQKQKQRPSARSRRPLRGDYRYLLPLLRLSPLHRILASPAHVPQLLSFLKSQGSEDDVALLLFCVNFRKLQFHLAEAKPSGRSSPSSFFASSVLGAAAAMGLRRSGGPAGDKDAQQEHQELAEITHQYIR